MDTQVLERRFQEMGAKVRFGELSTNRHPWPPPSTRNRITLNIVNDVFVVSTNSDEIDVSVVNVDVKDRHLLLHVNDGASKSKFLCGHDERHWFVAAIPESAPGVTTVAKAKEALQPAAVRSAAGKIRNKNRLRRRNGAYVRQGEWFFTPVTGDFDEPPAHLIHKNDPITRGRGKPHIVEFLYRKPGLTVYVARGQGVIPAEQFNAMSPTERKKHAWRAQTEVTDVWAKGRVSHPDHATVTLVGWHRIEMNQEQNARAMQHVAFID